MNRAEIIEAIARALDQAEWVSSAEGAEVALSAIEALGMVAVPRVATEEWLPIESAPEDGELLLLGIPDDPVHDAAGIVDICYWDGERGVWILNEEGAGRHWRIQSCYTHWRPLPSPPQTKDTGHD